MSGVRAGNPARRRLRASGPDSLRSSRPLLSLADPRLPCYTLVNELLAPLPAGGGVFAKERSCLVNPGQAFSGLAV
jgi:hypothetical protein